MPEPRAVRRVRALVAHPPAAAPSLRHLAARAGLSRWHLHRVFKRRVGLTPGQFLRARRCGAELGIADPLPAAWSLDDMLAWPGEGSHEESPRLSSWSLDDLLAWPG